MADIDEHPDRALAERKFYPADQQAGFAERAPTHPADRAPGLSAGLPRHRFPAARRAAPGALPARTAQDPDAAREARVGSTLVVYGSARIPPPAAVAAALAGAAALPEVERRVVESLAAKARYYEEAYRLARLVSEKAIIEDGERQFVVCSGGGPSIMEAANKGAADAGVESIGLNIVLPHEQAPNPYVTPGLSFQFHYFALRKMHFLLRARAVAVFPGGSGTFDELFELLTLIQTGKMKPIPVLLFGRDYWTRIIDFAALAEEWTVSRADLALFRWCETAEEAWEHVAAFYGMGGG